MRTSQNLNGVWSFGFYGEEIPAYPFVKATDFTSVPGCFDLIEPNCGKRGWAVYSRKVTCGGLVQLEIDGSGFVGNVWFDGKVIADLKHPYMPETFTFDAGNCGEHELAIVLNNEYNDQFHPFFDFYGYGGIYGDVTLTNVAPDHVTRLYISTEDYKTGKLHIRCEAANNYSGSAKLVFDTGYQLEANFVNGAFEVDVTLPEFKLWSIEEPNLHTLTVILPEDEFTETFGIRTVETAGRKILLNGKAIKLIGVNRHESHPEIGAAMPAQLIATDLQLLKNAGYNYVRGSHYPQRKAMLELCDRMGIVVWEETLGWGLKPEHMYNDAFLASQREQVAKLTRAHFNHPCIIIRSFLNENASEEAGTPAIIQALYDEIRAIDKHCLITFASNRYEKCLCTGIVDVVAMNPYPGWYDSNWETINTVPRVKPRLRELSDAMPQDKPYLITEIGAEALLGFRDPLKTYWSEEYQEDMLMAACEYTLENDDCAGISIWHFADTRSYVSGKHIFGRARGFNNKGIVDEYRRPKMAWNALKKLFTGNK